MSKFDVVDSYEMYNGHVIDVRVDQVEMPNGEIAAREVAEHKDAVAVVAIDNDDVPHVALVYQYRHPLGEHIFELPAGLCDVEGEDRLETAKRELAEETGTAATDWRELVTVASSPGFTTEKVYLYAARGLSAVERVIADDAGEEQDLTVRWLPLKNAVDMIYSGDIISAHTVAGLLAAAREMGI